MIGVLKFLYWLLLIMAHAYFSMNYEVCEISWNFFHIFFLSIFILCTLTTSSSGNSTTIIMPSPTKLRRDIVVHPSVHNILCEHSRINILRWILTKLGTYLVLKRIWNLIDFQGHRSKIKVTGSNFYRVISLWTL